jgi:putative membrane protein insertion efficiency factor
MKKALIKLKILQTLVVKALVLLIELYRKCISPALGPRCRFYPSCSQYSLEVLQKYGLLQGVQKSVKRLCKCHPFCKGGVDWP